MSEFNVFDASALLAYELQEYGMAVVDAAMDIRPNCASAVNISEVLQKLIDHGMPADQALRSIHDLRVQIIPFDETHALKTARLQLTTRSIGASFGDRACLALAALLLLQGHTPILYTAEKSWAKLKWPFKLVVIR